MVKFERLRDLFGIKYIFFGSGNFYLKLIILNTFMAVHLSWEISYVLKFVKIFKEK